MTAADHKKHIATPCQSCFDSPKKAEVVTFTTSFGVEVLPAAAQMHARLTQRQFGVFICLDILYTDPPQELLARGIRHFVFPTSWNNLPPMFTATQFQQVNRVSPSPLTGPGVVPNEQCNASGCQLWKFG